MKMLQRKSIFVVSRVALIWIWASMGWTASVDFDIQPRVLKVGEAATCSFTIRGIDNPPTPDLPPIQGFQASFAGTQQSFSFVNGRQDSSVSFNYQLVPLRAGKFSIGPFTYSAQNQTFNLPAIDMEVVPPEETASMEQTQPDTSEPLFATLTTSQTNIYNQQLFDIVLTIYSQGLNIGNKISLMNMPSSGLSLQAFQELQGSREVVNNKVYDVRRFRAKAQALTAGTFTLEPTLQIPLLVQRERRRGFPGFDSFLFDDFFGTVQAQPVNITPKPLEIKVNPLPAENQPPGFGGAVGHFSFETQVKPTELNAGDPITLTAQIVGEGNMENISAPHLIAGDDFKIYEPRLISKDIDSNRGIGRKTFEQVLIPRSDKVTMLPALTFSYFDPTKAAYETITRGPYPLVVHASSNATAKLLQAVQTSPEVSTIILDTDIVYLKPAPTHWTISRDRPWYLHPFFLVMQLLPILTVGVIFFSVMRREKLAGDVALARRHQAPHSARVGLRKAENALSSDDPKAFVEAVWETLASYFGNRLNLSPGEITSDVVLRALIASKLNPATTEQVRDLFSYCEEGRFGDGVSKTTLLSAQEKKVGSTILSRLNHVLKECERIRL